MMRLRGCAERGAGQVGRLVLRYRGAGGGVCPNPSPLFRVPAAEKEKKRSKNMGLLKGSFTWDEVTQGHSGARKNSNNTDTKGPCFVLTFFVVFKMEIKRNSEAFVAP